MYEQVAKQLSDQLEKQKEQSREYREKLEEKYNTILAEPEIIEKKRKKMMKRQEKKIIRIGSKLSRRKLKGRKSVTFKL